MLIKFEIALMQSHIPAVSGNNSGAMIAILGLVDAVLIANLLLTINFARYGNLIARIDVGSSEDHPKQMGSVGLSDLTSS